MQTTNNEELTPDIQWREWVRGHPVGAAAIIGLVATQMATIVGYYLRAIGLPQVPWPLYNGALGAPAGEFGSPASFFVGQSIHMVDGVVLTILFVLLAHAKLPGKNDTFGQPRQGADLRHHPRPHQHGLPGSVRVRTQVGLRLLQLLQP